MAQTNRRSLKKESNFVPIIFILVAIVVAAMLLFRLAYLNKQTQQVRDRVVIPISGNDQERRVQGDSTNENLANKTSFVQLRSNETLISVQSFDFNADSYVDQVVAIRKASSPHITLLVGIYDSDNNEYLRVSEIATEISRERTFTYAGIDVIGEHQNALVYQGVNDNGNSVMAIYQCQNQRNGYVVNQIGSFESDGTIFIQQEERSDAYMLSNAKGKSFSVWIYSSASTETESSNANLSQIQTEYVWNEKEDKYIEARQIWVTGNRIAAKELARIQDGTVATFASFLSGLWYKTSDAQDLERYVFFDYDTREINFFSDGTEEVYSWDESNLRRNGIYLSTTNSTIANMRRRCDISLVGLDEIRLYIVDDVRMLIRENNLWDGSYRKVPAMGTLSNDAPRIDYATELRKGPSWTSNNGMRFIFSKNAYTLFMDNATDKGSFATGTIANTTVIQFRSMSPLTQLAPAYEMHFNTITIPATRRRQAETQIDYNTIVLSPVRLSPDECFPIEGRTFVLTRDGNTVEGSS